VARQVHNSTENAARRLVCLLPVFSLTGAADVAYGSLAFRFWPLDLWEAKDALRLVLAAAAATV